MYKKLDDYEPKHDYFFYSPFFKVYQNMYVVFMGRPCIASGVQAWKYLNSFCTHNGAYEEHTMSALL